jgi:SAM-dependent methyltransferase
VCTAKEALGRDKEMEHEMVSPLGDPIPFPVSLTCPKCKNVATRESVCSVTSQPCMTEDMGIPRFLFGQKYWGETSSANMARILAQAQATNWRDALLANAREEPISAHLLSGIRADFLHAFPWPRIKTVLDVGAGMGFMASDMARYADSVVALEAVPERAHFLRIRARQDGLPVFPVIADATSMPFQPGSFDLITLNGAFEYLGLWADGDPQAAQEEFLRRALELLKPGGLLYVGIETRFSAANFLGARDHSGLSFTSLMPRRIADVYCRIRNSPYYGAEHVAKGYRTYTYTAAQYGRMISRAGFGDVSIKGIFDGYNRQKVVYDLHDRAARDAVMQRINPPASVAGVLRRACTENRFVYRIFEGEVAILASKHPVNRASAPWAEALTSGRTVVQVNLPFKVLGVVCDRGVPTEVLEVEKKGESKAALRLAHAATTLEMLHSHLASKITSLPMRWPIPQGVKTVTGRSYYQYEYIAGQSLSAMLLPLHYDERKVSRFVSRAIDSYVKLCRQLSDSLPATDLSSRWQTAETQLDGIEASASIREAYREAMRAAKQANWELSPVHGDFTASNLLITEQGQFVLIDWEHFSRNYFVGADLLRFLQDALMDSTRLPTKQREAFRRVLHDEVGKGLQTCGHSASDLGHLQALYIGQQIAALGGESHVYPPLIEAYKSGLLFPADQWNYRSKQP